MNRIDATRPDSPLLSGPGAFPVGATTRVLTDPARLDPYAGTTGPRGLTIEMWYPAVQGTVPGGAYRTLLRDGIIPVTLLGRAARDATPLAGRWPVVLISHGYPGNRFLMGHLAEALASRGYLVAAADHPQSTYDDLGPFGATLYHRPLDQAFVLRALASDPLAEPDRAAIIGYSMGGYGALVSAGAGLAPGAEEQDVAPPGAALTRHHAPDVPQSLRAVIAIGPWGNARAFWTPETLAAVRVPLLVMAGSRDDTSDYPAIRAIAEATKGTLLTFANAGHNAAAPIPAPAESHAHSDALGWAPFLHYADAVWDSVRMNALAQHFAAAFLDRHLKGETGRDALLDPATALTEAAGFAPGTDAGLRLERWGA